jgi:pimeloyl-ACP methyl ester carboxylesterase
MPPAKSQSPPRTPPRRNPSPAPPEVVDPVWLLKALGVCFAAALLCGYATLCLLVYQGAWQLILHPSRVVTATPAQAGIDYSDVRFDAAETGQPRLTGWWIPAASNSGFQPRYAAFTVLYLHDGTGSLANTVPALARLHAAGLNVFAFDYRSFGASDASAHPSQQRMAEDADAALRYLTATRHIPAGDLVPYGVGLGASLAAGLAATHPGLPVVILDNPIADPASIAVAAHPSHIVPVRLLFGRQFDIATSLATLKTPKLLIAGGINASAETGSPDSLENTLFRHAASPSMSVTLPRVGDAAVYQAALSRFLDQYLAVR